MQGFLNVMPSESFDQTSNTTANDDKFRILRLEEGFAEVNKATQQLHCQLGASRAQIEAAEQHTENISKDREELQGKLADLERTLLETRRELAIRSEKSRTFHISVVGNGSF